MYVEFIVNALNKVVVDPDAIVNPPNVLPLPLMVFVVAFISSCNHGYVPPLASTTESYTLIAAIAEPDEALT